MHADSAASPRARPYGAAASAARTAVDTLPGLRTRVVTAGRYSRSKPDPGPNVRVRLFSRVSMDAWPRLARRTSAGAHLPGPARISWRRPRGTIVSAASGTVHLVHVTRGERPLRRHRLKQ